MPWTIGERHPLEYLPWQILGSVAQHDKNKLIFAIARETGAVTNNNEFRIVYHMKTFYCPVRIVHGLFLIHDCEQLKWWMYSRAVFNRIISDKFPPFEDDITSDITCWYGRIFQIERSKTVGFADLATELFLVASPVATELLLLLIQKSLAIPDHFQRIEEQEKSDTRLKYGHLRASSCRKLYNPGMYQRTTGTLYQKRAGGFLL